LIDLDKVLRPAVSSGRALFGVKQTVKALAKNTLRWVIVASNCPAELREKIEPFKVPVHEYEGTNVELGALCGKLFSVSVVGIKKAVKRSKRS
jgi:large subunit ribosomal protein L30e